MSIHTPHELRNELGRYQNCIARQPITESRFQNDSQNFLNPFYPSAHFCTPWKLRKTYGCSHVF